jgi:hypothetical protein
MPIARTPGHLRAEACFRASGASKISEFLFFLFFPCNPLKFHETTKEKLAESKEKFADSQKILCKKKKKFGGVPAISIPRRARGRPVTRDVRRP